MLPAAIKCREIASRSSLNPRVATIQPVKVVPRLAPRIMPIELISGRMPAEAKASTMRLTIELLCNSAVVNTPVATLPIEVPVLCLSQ